ncbi:hypothetical protein NPX13_g7729 [Xylaria arbuscula]|uniref:NWD NACHT-NTPase N-terminal domain-containing protein n=1 Tax=Xylaria arbuscula TaxID=114810 RepID=A0A9W8TJ81_9PEZI|nr:hypothetical protein NPX13_g7729 [Xylaria arbuscula]
MKPKSVLISDFKSGVKFWKRTKKLDVSKSPTLNDPVDDAASTNNVDHEQENHEQENHEQEPLIEVEPKPLWDQAYENLREEKPHVVTAYEALLFRILPYLENTSSTTDLESLLSDPPIKTTPEERAQNCPIDRKKTMDDIINLGRKRMDEKGVVFKVGEQEFSLQDQIQTVVVGIQVGKVWIDEAVKASPLASAAWVGVCLLLSLLTNPVDVQGANEEGLAYVTQKIGFYTNMESRLLGEQNDALSPAEKQLFEEHFVALYQAIIDFQAQTVLRFFRRRFKTFLRDATKWDSWEEMLKKVKELGENLEKESLHFNSISSNASLNALGRWAKGTEEERCLQCLSREDYVWYKNRVADRVPDTCLWFLNHNSYHSWLDADSGPLLVSADPGCGKSVLSKYLINSNFGFRVPKEAAICYFFFKEGDQNTIEQAFCALIHQLLCLRPQLTDHALRKYKQNGDKLASNTTALWRILQTAAADPNAGPIILVLDALDECLQDERNMKTLAGMIRTHFEEGPGNLKILMTSRPYQNTVQHIQELEELYTSIRIHGEDESEIICKEINSVIEHRVGRMKRFNNDFRIHLKQRLLRITHQTYLWIYLVFEYLESSTVKTTSRGLDEALRNLPITVEDAYEKILNRSQEPETTRKALFILLGTYRPLTLHEMQVALDINPKITSLKILDLESDQDFYNRLRNLCGLFVTKHDDKLYFLHQTAREFLLTISTSPPGPPANLGWAHSFSLRQAHTILAESCVTYIASHDLTILMQDEDSPASDILPESEVDFIEYSSNYWPNHIRLADLPDGADIVTLAARICQPDFRSFVWSCQDRYIRYFLDDCPSIYIASAFGLASVVRLLLSNGSDVELHYNHRETTLLALAAKYGHENVMKLLLAVDGIDVNLQGIRGDTALWTAACEGQEGSVKLLLAIDGIDVNVQTKDGFTPLNQATSKGHEEIVKLLLAADGIDVNLPDYLNCTPLRYAASHGHNAIVKLLLATDEIDVNWGSLGGSTPLHRAASKGYQTIVELLLATDNADVNMQDNYNNNTPLHEAVRRRQYEIVKLLLAAEEIQVDIPDKDGQTPLHLAAERGHLAIVQLLLESKAIVDLEDKDGNTPLSLAVHRGHKAMVELLEKQIVQIY